MDSDTVGIGLIGTGFARSAQAPAFRACEGAELAAVCSGSYENAQKTAAEFHIPQTCHTYQELLALAEVDLVVISAPPYLHQQMALAALEAGKHVICEKPMALNAAEARAMLNSAARHQRQLAVIDHELRFNPTWRRMKMLIDSGFAGDIQHVSLTIAAGFRHSALRPWNWWSQLAAGGGLLGALGSHAIDAVRWLFGEIEAVSSTVTTLVAERKDSKTGEMRLNETDDYVSALLRIVPPRGKLIHGTLLLSALYASGGKNNITIVGSNGTIVLDGDETLTAAQGFNHPFEDLSLGDRAREVSWLPDNIWARSFYHLAREAVQAVRENRTEIAHAATFADGLRCQEVIDAIKQAHAEQRWIEIG
ncbi:MAG: Gfo/Idh/MocA family oxidoreductase [Acidobacteria bacterium]|nr:Gfo/Idh/MocA family oxidoreductase [Acidobacteriota bacterium]MBI3421653.1 Gfo/Idh/MocA family oxidoreductase [Acidobacteriota bacterium]